MASDPPQKRLQQTLLSFGSK